MGRWLRASGTVAVLALCASCTAGQHAASNPATSKKPAASHASAKPSSSSSAKPSSSSSAKPSSSSSAKPSSSSSAKPASSKPASPSTASPSTAGGDAEAMSMWNDALRGIVVGGGAYRIQLASDEASGHSVGFDLSFASNGDEAGSVILNGGHFQVLKKDGVMYFRTDAAYLAQFTATPEQAAALAGRWLTTSDPASPAAQSAPSLAQVVFMIQQAVGPVRADGTTTWNGTPAWQVKDATGDVAVLVSDGTHAKIASFTGAPGDSLRIDKLTADPFVYAPSGATSLDAAAPAATTGA